MTGLLELQDVSVYYGDRAALQSVSFSLAHGAQAAVIGPNGAGKSTLFKAIVGLVPLRTGKILIHGRPPDARREPVAYVPQREEVDWRFPVTVFDVVAMGRYGRGSWLKRLSTTDRRVIQRAWNGWISPTWPNALSASCQADSSRGRFSPGRWCRSRMCFFSTSRSREWTWALARLPWSSWPDCAPAR